MTERAAHLMDTKDLPVCPWGEYFSSVQKKCVLIGSE
jgi:hypothetical protein